LHKYFFFFCPQVFSYLANKQTRTCFF
jgi:hypothetical protein